MSEDAASAIPVGGPRKLSQTSRNLDSSASLQTKTQTLSRWNMIELKIKN